MKRLVLALMGVFLFGLAAGAQGIASANYDRFADIAARDSSQCWECSLIEGLYTYTFDFAYKIYDRLRDVVRPLLILFMCLWFVWYVWQNAIVKPQGSIGKMFGDVLKKLALFIFVLSMLALPPKEIFRWTIDPVMNAGTGLAKWIMVETRNNSAVLENRKLGRFDCSRVTLNKNTLLTLARNRAAAMTQDGIKDDEETLRNLICVTMEYSNTYTIGVQFGFAIAEKGTLGYGIGFLAEGGYNNTAFQMLLTKLGPWKILVDVVVWIILGLGRFLNMLTIVLGGCIAVSFLYVAFVYVTAVIDIVVKLAMVGVMAPIALGSLLFENVRKDLFNRLVFNVVKCAFRISFLSVAISISTFLLNELMTMPFETGGKATVTIAGLAKKVGFDVVVDYGSLMDRVGLSNSLGGLSSRHESSGDPGAVLARDSNDSGSYGAWQINSGSGRMAEFMDTVLLAQAPEIRDALVAAGGERGAIDATPEFVAAWQRIAREQPDRFLSLQRDYIYESHFRPAFQGVQAALPQASALLDNPVIQDVVWSMAVQHGAGSVGSQNGAIGIMRSALGGQDAASLSPDVAIGLIYDARSQYVKETNLSDSWKKLAEDRYRAERKDALKMLE
ncbi:MAG: hypothetical protein LBI17_01970 [Rickettsiales bacterium]|jgi:hypothetical protein|nr:hypothetical protein [Rickettsiales bacterium]